MIGGVGAGDAELERAVLHALQDFLAAEGFADPVRARTGGVVIRRGDVLLRLWRTDRASQHRFEVQVSIGRQRTDDIVDWVRIPQLSAEGSIAHACWTWELPELPSLTAALQRLLDEVLVPHVAAFWRQPARLDSLLAALDREDERRSGAAGAEQNLRIARAERFFEQRDAERRPRRDARPESDPESGSPSGSQPGSRPDFRA